MKKMLGIIFLGAILMLTACGQATESKSSAATTEGNQANKATTNTSTSETANESQKESKLNDPFARLPEVASFNLTSSDIKEDKVLNAPQLSKIFGVENGEDASPQLTWSDVPEGTKSFAVTVYDPDASTGSGFWHWAVMNIPASVTSLPTGAGDEGGANLPKGAIQLPNDARAARYIGAAPPAGDGPHRYYIVVHALDVEDIGVDKDSTPAFLGFNMLSHTLGRAVIIATAEIK